MTTEQQPSEARAEAAARSKGAAPAAAGEGTAASLPQDALIILPVRNVVLYPGIMLPLALGTGPGAEERRTTAVVVIAGQTLLLFLTLVVVPVA